MQNNNNKKTKIKGEDEKKRENTLDTNLYMDKIKNGLEWTDWKGEKKRVIREDVWK